METGGQVRPKYWRAHRCRDRPRRLGDHHASAIDKARVTSGGGDDPGERRVDYDAPLSAASSAWSMGSAPPLT
jgi:hypothetical protein